MEEKIKETQEIKTEEFLSQLKTLFKKDKKYRQSFLANLASTIYDNLSKLPKGEFRRMKWCKKVARSFLKLWLG